MAAQPHRNGRSYTHPHVVRSRRSAAAAGLRYVTDASPGIARRASGRSFSYVLPDGSRVRESQTLARIRSLAVPPAWRQVWICARDDGHLQATGRDARGRKQYRYHPRWRETRDETKYGRVAAFLRALPRIRRRVSRDLALPGLPREKVLATLVRLLETTFIRVGNPEYARENDSFGLTTLRDHQVRVRGSRMSFEFRGKSGVQQRIELADPRLARIVRRMQDLPGEELFQYVDDRGETRCVQSDDVNAYLKDAAGAEFTSKDFRTWAGTVLAAETLRSIGPAASRAEARKNIVQAIGEVAARLGNTKAVCRKCYIHPAVLERYLEGSLAERLRGRSAEARVAALLRRENSRARQSRTRPVQHYRGTALAASLQQSLSNPLGATT